MKIVLGWHYDSGAQPDEMGAQEAAEGVVILGPLGIANILETRLGLAPAETAQSIRIACYLRALENVCAVGEPFFKASFRADNWATAKRLLAERDQIAMSGWDGRPVGQPRIDALAELHAIAGTPPGMADRLLRILAAIERFGLTGISQLAFETPRDCWPKVWRRLFKALALAGVDLHDVTPGADPDFIPPEWLSRALPLRCFSLANAAEAVATWLAAGPEDNADILLLNEGNGEILDAALHKQGLPMTGATSHSAHRAPLQLLPLALQLCWSPFSPAALLDFLTAPICPVHPALARRIIRALEEQPGIGGTSWREAFGLCGQWAAGREDGPALLDDLDFWTGLPRAPRMGEAPSRTLLAVCERLAAWVTDRSPKGCATLLAPAAAAAREMVAVVHASGRSGFTKPQLDRILDAVIGCGTSAQGETQAAPWAVARHPGQVRGTFRDIIWWNFMDPGQSATRPIWDKAEQAALLAVSVDMEDARRTNELEAKAWRRPLRHASGRLLLVMADADKGEPCQPHPLWDELVAGVGESELLGRAEDASLHGRGPEVQLCGRALRMEELSRLETPQPMRVWPVPGGLELRRETESPSSIAKLVECPLRWFLEYTLGIRPGQMAALPDGNMLFGIFCHRLVEALVAEKSEWEPEAARQRAEQMFGSFLDEMAAALKLPGREADLATFREQALHAVETLFGRISETGLRILGCERPMERVDDAGQAHAGRIDLLLQDRSGNPVPWDLKWTNNPKYRREEMQSNRAVQLAAYCWLLSAPPGSTHAAFFMLKQAELIATDAPWAKGEEAVPTDLAAVWAEALACGRRQMEALRLGEALAPGVLEDGADAPEPAPRCNLCNYGIICGARHAE